ncbi:Peptide chain release factor 1, mitochondrial [Thecaphora frezii]
MDMARLLAIHTIASIRSSSSPSSRLRLPASKAGSNMSTPTTARLASLLAGPSRATRRTLCSQCRPRPAGKLTSAQPPQQRFQAPPWHPPTLASSSGSIRFASSSAIDNIGSSPSNETITLDIDSDVAVRLAKIKMQWRQRLLYEQAAAASGSLDPSLSASSSLSSSQGLGGTLPADAVGKQLKELEPVRQTWEEFEQKRRQLISTLHMSESDPDADMRSMALEEVSQLEAELQEARDALQDVLLASSDDPIEATAEGAILELRPGVGGQESSLFVAEVTRMYTKFCENKPADDDGSGEWQVEPLSFTSTDVTVSGSGHGAGLKEAILQVKGKGAYRRLKYEAGVHRVQRVPATQSLGKLQSSTIAVMVLPVSANNDADSSKADDLVDPKDVKTEVMRSRGAGGQHVNKTESAIRLTHEPTGITVSMQDSRSQHQNRTKAWAVLRARLLDRKMRQEVEGNRAKRLAQVAGMDRSDRIRTYNFPQDRVTDHRINLSLTGIDSIMEGEHEVGLGLEYMISQLEAESKRRKLEVMLEMAESDEQQASGANGEGGRGGKSKGKKK